jgi:putative ABC transport system ATP-binding protein
LIRAASVTKVYAMGEQPVRALDGVSLDIDEGEFVAIMGPSGSGKSTMMNLIGALDVPTSGTMYIDGRNVAALTSDELAALRNRTIGFVFQQFNLLARTPALRQVMLPLLYTHPKPPNAEERARGRLEQVGLADRLEHLPSQLSGGQQQRVAIARALINDPKILLADEPTGALDSKTSEEIMALFGALNRQGITVIIVTHEADIAAYARRRVQFRDGRVVEDVPQPGRLHAASAYSVPSARTSPSPQVREGRRGGDGGTSAGEAPPTPNPSPQAGRECARRAGASASQGGGEFARGRGARAGGPNGEPA